MVSPNGLTGALTAAQGHRLANQGEVGMRGRYQQFLIAAALVALKVTERPAQSLNLRLHEIIAQIGEPSDLSD